MKKSSNPIIDLYTSGSYFQRYNAKTSDGLKDHERGLFDTFCPDKSSSVCSLGCGSGRELFALYKLGYENITGVDFSEALLTTAKDYSNANGMRIKFVRAAADQTHLAEQSFDVVTLFDNLYGHITPHRIRRRTMKEVHRILKPAGRVFIVANSIFFTAKHFAAIAMMDILKAVHNPHCLERGDKLFKNPVVRSSSKLREARSHWFRPVEIISDARKAGMTTVLATTIKGFAIRRTDKFLSMGWLVFVLKRKEVTRCENQD